VSADGEAGAAPGDRGRWAAGAYAAWMRRALAEAARGTGGADVPVGALVVDESGETVGWGRNARERDGDPTAHAEVVALRHAGAGRQT